LAKALAILAVDLEAAGLGVEAFRRGLDEETVREVADLTGGEYYLAESADELLDVFAEVPAHLTTARVTLR
jgi:hypothetical protein